MKRALMAAFNDNNLEQMTHCIKANPALANLRFRKSGDKMAPSDPLIYHALCKLNRAMVELLEPPTTSLSSIDIARLDDLAKKLERDGKIDRYFKNIVDCACANNAIKCKRIPSDLSSRTASPATVFTPNYGSFETLKTDASLAREFDGRKPKQHKCQPCCTIS